MTGRDSTGCCNEFLPASKVLRHCGKSVPNLGAYNQLACRPVSPWLLEKFFGQIRAVVGMKLRATLQEYDVRGGFVGHAILWADGRVVDSSTGSDEYPSAFRATFDSSGQTTHAFFNGRSLCDGA